MKKLFSFLLIAVLLLTLLSCDAGGGAETGGTPEETTDEAPAETLPKVADTETPWYIEADRATRDPRGKEKSCPQGAAPL